MSETNTNSTEQTDAQIVARLRRTTKPKTAADLGTTAKRLRGLADQGVVEAGSQQTGKAGRPAILFTLTDEVRARSGANSAQTQTNSEDQD